MMGDQLQVRLVTGKTSLFYLELWEILIQFIDFCDNQTIVLNLLQNVCELSLLFALLDSEVNSYINQRR